MGFLKIFELFLTFGELWAFMSSRHLSCRYLREPPSTSERRLPSSALLYTLPRVTPVFCQRLLPHCFHFSFGMSLSAAELANLVPDRHLCQIRNIHFNELDLVPVFLCRDHKIELHMHAKASHLLYHLGSKALTGDHRDSMRLTSIAASRWKAFMKPKVKAALTVAQSLKAVGQDVRI